MQLCKSRGEKERYKHLYTEFQRIARRDKKAFFSEQWKEIKENNSLLITNIQLLIYTGKGEKEKYTHLNAEFQRIARRDKAFLSNQWKEVEENNRMGKSTDLFKKIRDTKGTFHVKMDSIKDRNGMDLTEAEDTKKRWQEYMEELYKKDLHDPVIMMM